jgi:hypothetical protein
MVGLNVGVILGVIVGLKVGSIVLIDMNRDEN